MKLQQGRLPRFSRSEEAPTLALTERDIELVSEIAKHRFIRSTQLSELLGGSHKKLCARLMKLFHAGYVDRPLAQLAYHIRGGGSSPIIYALGHRGARLLTKHRSTSHEGTNWTKNNRDAGREFMLHALAVTEFHVQLQKSCKRRSEITLLDKTHMHSQAKNEAAERQWHWRVRVHDRGVSKIVGIIPDYIFAILLADGRRRPFVVECDRGTMPITRNSLDQTSMLRKFIAYETARSERLLETYCGWKNFRVLVVTSSPERLTHMQNSINSSPRLRTSPLFLFASHEALMHSDVCMHDWLTASGTTQSIVL